MIPPGEGHQHFGTSLYKKSTFPSTSWGQETGREQIPHSISVFNAPGMSDEEPSYNLCVLSIHSALTYKGGEIAVLYLSLQTDGPRGCLSLSGLTKCLGSSGEELNTENGRGEANEQLISSLVGMSLHKCGGSVHLSRQGHGAAGGDKGGG